jgi:hypothetical protein
VGSDHIAAIDEALAEIGAVHERVGRAAWRVGVPCVDRRSITVGMAGDERTLRMQAFVLRAPDRRHREVYRRLLQKNLDLRVTGPWRFALDELGDVYLVAQVPLAALDTAALDGVLGALAGVVDATWAGLVAVGFAAPERGPDPGPPGPPGPPAGTG